MRAAAFRMLLGIALVTLAPVHAAPPALAAGAVDQRSDGPAVGARVGALLAARDHEGAARDFASLRGKNGLIVLFSRSFHW